MKVPPRRDSKLPEAKTAQNGNGINFEWSSALGSLSVQASAKWRFVFLILGIGILVLMFQRW